VPLSLIGTFAGLPTALCVAMAIAEVGTPAASSLIAYRRIEGGKA
jgi:hypothetical protein